MCGRYTIYQTGELKSRYHVDDDELKKLLKDLKKRYNAAPGQNLPVVTRDTANHISFMRWGLIPVWAKEPQIGYRMINAKAETLFDKPTWKRPALKSRCLIPANGFYEWKTEEGHKQPYYIRPKDQDLFSFAGIYDHWTDQTTGEVIESFSIITTEPNKEVKSIHDRMPVILRRSEEDRWLDPASDTPESVADLLHTYDDNKLDIVRVSPEVNTAKVDKERLIYPLDKES